MSDGVKRYLVEYDHLLEKMPDRTCACTGVVLASDYLRVSGDCAAWKALAEAYKNAPQEGSACESVSAIQRMNAAQAAESVLRERGLI